MWKPQNVSHLKEFGCQVLPLDMEFGKDKLQPTSRKMYFYDLSKITEDIEFGILRKIDVAWNNNLSSYVHINAPSSSSDQRGDDRCNMKLFLVAENKFPSDHVVQDTHEQHLDENNFRNG